ncbi:metallopeptidase family protein [Aminobacterium mobile]|uniref:metallopeptidase family protein n=1 Tax=Aminobacterium mobile TaxID=81467 RepID=UPI0033149D41
MNINKFRETTNEIVEELPRELFKQLNGGIIVLDEKKEEAESLIMGEYVEDPFMGKTILLYYGSFVDILEGASLEEWGKEIEDTIIHELRHHIESLAGVDYLSEEERQTF